MLTFHLVASPGCRDAERGRRTHIQFILPLLLALSWSFHAVTQAQAAPARCANYRAQLQAIRAVTDSNEQTDKAQSLYQHLEKLRAEPVSTEEQTEIAMLRLEVLLLLEDWDKAAQCASSLLLRDPEKGSLNESIPDAVCRFSQEARSKGASRQAKRCEAKMLQLLKSQGLSTSSYNIFKRAFFHNLYEFADAGTMLFEPLPTDAKLTSQLLHLRARVRATRFLEYADANNLPNRWPTKQETPVLRRLAKACTKSYEDLFTSAQDDFRRAQISNEWWGLNGHMKYEADSLVLRKAFPLIKPALDQQTRDRLHQQAHSLYKATLHALAAGRDGQRLLNSDGREIFAQALSDEFRILGVVRVPDKVFDDLLQSLPAFCDIGLDRLPLHPSGSPSTSKGPNVLGATIQFYLWTALLQPLPDEIERRFIDEQVETICRLITVDFDRALDNPRLTPVGKQYAAEFREIYNRLKDNRFIPYFKSAWPQYRMNSIVTEVEKACLRVRRNFLAALRTYDQKSLTQAVYRIEHQDYLFALKSNVWAATAHLDGPMFRYHSPGAEIYAFQAGTNQHGLYVFTITGIRPFEPFPLEKEAERRNSPNETGN